MVHATGAVGARLFDPDDPAHQFMFKGPSGWAGHHYHHHIITIIILVAAPTPAPCKRAASRLTFATPSPLEGIRMALLSCNVSLFNRNKLFINIVVLLWKILQKHILKMMITIDHSYPSNIETHGINAKIRNINERLCIIFISILSPMLFQVECWYRSNLYDMKNLHEIVKIIFQFSFHIRRQTKMQITNHPVRLLQQFDHHHF